MELKTASSVINYISKFETDSADFYNRSAVNYSDCGDLFKSLAKENKKFGKRIKKAYYNSVTDALETNFSFQGLQAGVEIPETESSQSVADQLSVCLKLEKDIQAFYVQAADLSKGLLDDVNRVMQRLAGARDKRRDELSSRLGE